MRFVTSRPFLLFCVSVILFSCTKIEYTTLGGNVVPDVDNVTTFDTTLDVITENFQQSDDTLKLDYFDQLTAGQIINDPLFGGTNAAIYFEVKPPSFPAIATARNFIDSSLSYTGVGTGYDSTVLCIKYDGGYGDTSLPIDFYVYALADTIARLTDKIYPLNNFTASFLVSNPTPQSALGTKSVSLNSLSYDSVLISRSTVLNYKKTRELRIPLSNNDFWRSLLSDTVSLADDEAYRKKFKGIALVAKPRSATGSLAYFSISDTATRLQFYYRRRNGGVIDTTSTSFAFNPNNSGYANNVVWDRGTTAELQQHINRADSVIYVKTNPGTQVRIRIPGLENVSNRIIHRAELKTYIIPSNNTITDGFLSPPPVIYLERYDTTGTATYLPIPLDLSPNELYGNCFPGTNGINYSYFGGYPRNESTNGVSRQFYAFNISRYVQQIVTKKLTNSPLRLTANINAQYVNCNSGVPFRATNNIVSYGRVKLGGGGRVGVNSLTKMRLRIIYSKI